jgi:anaerobic dimethyl sulfoxide reductase subunit B (iron-sulfur subunit)
MSTQYAFYFDSNACTGCKACQTACKDKHDLPVGQTWRKVYEISGGDWKKVGNTFFTDTFAYYMSIACNHCVNPICMEVCPADAIEKRDDGLVIINSDHCIGCRYCEWACPYGSPQFAEEAGKMTKCTGCNDYVDKGLPPQCVSACPSRALDFGEIGEMMARHGNIGDSYEVSEYYPLPDSKHTLPGLIIKPHKNAVGIDGTSARVANEEEV